MTVADYDDFVLWVTLGIIVGGRLGYVLFYNPSYFVAHPAGDPCSSGRAACRSTAAFSAASLAVVLFARQRGLSILSLGDITCAAGTIGICSSAASPISSTASSGAAPPTCPGPWYFQSGGPLPRHPSQLYEAALEGLVLFLVLDALHTRAARSSGRASSSARSRSATALARIDLRVLPRARSRSSGSCGAG